MLFWQVWTYYCQATRMESNGSRRSVSVNQSFYYLYDIIVDTKPANVIQPMILSALIRWWDLASPIFITKDTKCTFLDINITWQAIPSPIVGSALVKEHTGLWTQGHEIPCWSETVLHSQKSHMTIQGCFTSTGGLVSLWPSPLASSAPMVS